ncbi:MAG: hypothetical protein IJX16_01665 [Clostridia bacterium]|nr:hypothetical protein [Clostridia bacterium]
MKKFFAILFSVFCLTLLFPACSSGNNLSGYVSEMRSIIYHGEGQTLSLNAGYGFKEQPFINDGKVGKTVNSLTFKLIGKETDDVTYHLSFNYNDTDYKSTFKLNPITDTVTCSVEIDGFYLNEFTVKISFGANSEEITLKSAIPENTITHLDALKYLQKNQGALISHYTDDEGNFNAEIYMRILVKDGAPFWYVGIASGNENLKALLIDGFSGEILAIREIF